MLLSFKNINIWSSYGQKIVCMPIFGYTYFGLYLAISGPIGLKFFIGGQETIIYRLVMRILCYDAYFSVLIFWATFGGKVGVATTRALNGLRPPNQTKTLAHLVDLLGQPLSQNHIFEIFRGEPPPP